MDVGESKTMLNFDPYDVLMKLNEEVNKNHRNIIELAKAHNQTAKSLENLAQQHTDITGLLIENQVNLKKINEEIALIQKYIQNETE